MPQLNILIELVKGGVVSKCMLLEASLLPELWSGAKDRPFYVCRNGGAHVFSLAVLILATEMTWYNLVSIVKE